MYIYIFTYKYYIYIYIYKLYMAIYKGHIKFTCFSIVKRFNSLVFTYRIN